MASSSASADRDPDVPGDSMTDPTLDQVLRDAGFTVTEDGRERWRRRLATPIPAEALAEAERLSNRARGHAA